MSYETDCPCGKVLTVAAADAGGKVRCAACGRIIEVPSLSRLRRLDGPAPPSGPSQDYAYLRVPGFIVAVVGALLGCVSGWFFTGVGVDDPLARAAPALAGYAAQIVGVALVCVSKRFPVVVSVVLPLFCVVGLVAAMLIPERLPPMPPPPPR